MPKNKEAAPDAAVKEPRNFYGGMLIMLAGPAFMACYFYGFQALLLLAVSVLSAVLSEAFCSLILRRKDSGLADLNAVFTGAVIALMLPANAPLFLAATGSIFAVLAAKLPFGGAKTAPFMPAAAGFAFLCVCWPGKVFHYPAVTAQFGAAAPFAGESLASLLHNGNSLSLNFINVFDILAGNVPGPMGAGCILVILASSCYLLFTRPKTLLAPLGYAAGCAVSALLFPRVSTGHFSSMFLELCSGTLVFTALFLLPDPAVSPQGGNLRRAGYGVLSGVLCMVMRHFGAYEEGACFALLLSNAVWPFIENRLGGKRSAAGKKSVNNLFAGSAPAVKNGGGAHGE